MGISSRKAPYDCCDPVSCFGIGYPLAPAASNVVSKSTPETGGASASMSPDATTIRSEMTNQ